jgi:hypothetical protein
MEMAAKYLKGVAPIETVSGMAERERKKRLFFYKQALYAMILAAYSFKSLLIATPLSVYTLTR